MNQVVRRGQNPLPSEFLSRMGFTSGAWLTGAGRLNFRLSAMNNEEFRLIGEDAPGFYHHDIQGRNGAVRLWFPWFRLKNGRYLKPVAFVSMPQGYGLKVFTRAGGSPEQTEVHLLADLLKAGVRPVFDVHFHDSVILRKSDVFIRANILAETAHA